MQRDARAYLWDIRQCADAITKFTTGMGFAAYAQDELVRAAVERKFEIIGEALGQLNKIAPDLANRIPDVRDVIAFRNVLIHGYAAVDHARVWRAIQESLPDLRSAAVMLLDELGPPQSL
jgi:uncharacterized protein with HEPN domain